MAAPVMHREATVTVTGWIAAREEAGARGARLYLSVHDMAGVSAGPLTVRVTVRGNADRLSVGDAVTLKARLQPPGGAVMPGGYDFARSAYLPGDRCGRLRLRSAQAGARAGAGAARDPPERAAGTAARRDPPAHRGGAARRRRPRRGGADDGRPRRHRAGHAGRHARLRARPHAVDLRAPHGAGRRLGLLAHPRAVGALGQPRARPADQEMGGRRRVRCRHRLSRHLRSGSCHGALLRDAGRHADRGDARPAGNHAAQRRPRCVRRPAGESGERDRPELPDVLWRDRSAGRRLRGDLGLARPARRAHRPPGDRTGDTARTGGDGTARHLDHRRARHRALRCLPLPARGAADAARQFRRHAGSRCCGDADGFPGRCGDAASGSRRCR